MFETVKLMVELTANTTKNPSSPYILYLTSRRKQLTKAGVGKLYRNNKVILQIKKEWREIEPSAKTIFENYSR